MIKEGNKKVGQPALLSPSFEDSMLIDLVRAMRRDRRDALKRKPKSKRTSEQIDELTEEPQI